MVVKIHAIYEVADLGPMNEDPVAYPDLLVPAARLVANAFADRVIAHVPAPIDVPRIFRLHAFL